MKRKIFFESLLIMFSLSLGCLGFSTWIIAKENTESTSINLSATVGDFIDNCPIKLVTANANGKYTNDGFYKKYYETVDGTSYEFLKPATSTFRVKYVFDLDNTKYKYDVNSGGNLYHFICVSAKMKVTGLNSSIESYFGTPHQSGNDLCVDENGSGWWQKSSFTITQYNSSSKTQNLNTGDHNITNKNYQNNVTRFFLEYQFKDIASIVGNDPIKFDLQLKLRYNQL